jgi:pimeloyl-ACP methyl ester carboxylesterase
VVAIDRPGFGRSTYQRRRRLLDWPADVAALADELGIERFAVAGYSSGGK